MGRDLSKLPTRELLYPKVDDYDRAARQWEKRVQAAIDRDERLTRKLAAIDAWRDKWIYELPLRATTELDKITGDAL